MKSAIYPGSFDPVTLGHIDIIHRAAAIFDEVTICILENNVDSYYGLMVDYAKQIGANISIRGVRAVSDFEYELQLAQTNRMLSNGDLDTVFLTTSAKYSYLNSSGVKEIAAFGGDISKCVTPYVEKLIWEKLREKKENK